MEQIFTAQPYLKKLKVLLYSLSYYSLVCGWIIAFLFSIELPLFYSQFIRLALYISITILLCAQLVDIVITQVLRAVYVLNEKGIGKKTPRRTVVLPYDEIRSCQFIWLLPGIGFGRVATKDTILRIPLYLKNCSTLIDILKQQLVAHGKKDLLNTNKLEHFKTKAYIKEQTKEKTFFLLPYLGYSIIIMALVNAVVALTIWELSPITTFAWLVVSISFPLLNDGITRLFFFIILTIKSDSSVYQYPNIDLKGIYGITSLCSLIVFLFCGIIYKNFFI